MRRTADPGGRLAAGLAALELDARLAAPLTAYLAELSKWNRAYNLTAIRDADEMVTRHVLDSLAILPVVEPHLGGRAHLRLLDVGSGAGLPGIPLALARPGWHVTLLDSNGKKARFLRHAVRTLGLPNVDVVEARAESLLDARANSLSPLPQGQRKSPLPQGGRGRSEGPGEGAPEARGPYDAIVSRAFAALSDFVNATRGLLAHDGAWLAMKGKLDPAEIGALPATVQVIATAPVTVPGLDEDRHVVVMRQCALPPDPPAR